MIDPQAPRRGLDSTKPEACKHPADQVLDFEDRSYCKKCQQDVPPPDAQQSTTVQSVPSDKPDS